MDAKKEVINELIKYMRATFEANLASTLIVCNYAEKLFELAITQSDAAQEGWKKIFKEWLELCKKARDDYFRLMNENFLALITNIYKDKEKI